MGEDALADDSRDTAQENSRGDDARAGAAARERGRNPPPGVRRGGGPLARTFFMLSGLDGKRSKSPDGRMSITGRRRLG